MEIEPRTTLVPDLEHPDDGQYIWLPILVLLGVIVLAGLVTFTFTILSLLIFVQLHFPYLHMRLYKPH